MTKQIVPYAMIILTPVLLLLIILRGRKIYEYFSKRFSKEDPAPENGDRAMKVKELEAIEKNNFEALGTIRVALSEDGVSDEFLKTTVVPEFNRNTHQSEHLPTNLSGKKLRKAILDKAEEYNITSNPRLEILADTFVVSAKKNPDKRT